MPKPATWVLPVTNAAAFDRCTGSLASEIKNKLLVVDNSKGGVGASPLNVYRDLNGENLGCSKSWNRGLDLMYERRDDFLVLLSQSVTFGAPGGMDFAGRFSNPGVIYGCETLFGWHCIAIHRQVFDVIGRFDEQFWPAYYDDSDALRRMRLAGLRSYHNHDGWEYQTDIDMTYEGDAMAIKRGDVTVDLAELRRKYIAKWGSDPGRERYTAPYNTDGTSNPEDPPDGLS